MAEQLLEVTNLNILIQRLKDTPNNFDRNVRKAMTESVTELKKNIVSQSDFPVYMGALRRSIGSKVENSGSEIIGRVGSDLKSEEYPAVMEFGRKPGTMPPPSALERWVQLKMQINADRVPSVAFLVARKIKEKGIPGKHFMQKGLDASTAKIQEYMNKAAEAIVQEIARGR